MNKKTLNDLNFTNKKVLLRLDFNVPIINKEITSTKRIEAALPTIKKLIANGGKVIIFSHLGRVKSESDKIKHSLAIVAQKLSSFLNQDVLFVNQTRGIELEAAINNLKAGEILMVQNTRYEDVLDGELVNFESKNDSQLGKYWASLGDCFVNDAFGTAHRSHASNVGIAKYSSESAVGFLIEKELKMLSQAVDHPVRPLISIIGGAKVSDKINVIENLLEKSDKLLIGGGMAYTFMKAQNYEIGLSLVENDKLILARQLLDKFKGKLLLPLDFAYTDVFENKLRQETSGLNIPTKMMGMDIGTKTMGFFTEILNTAKTVVWNGPMGVFEFSNYQAGTIAVAKAIAKQKNVFSIIGGGDSAAAAIQLGFAKNFSHISTGGGASLMYLEGKVLPAIAIIQNKKN